MSERGGGPRPESADGNGAEFTAWVPEVPKHQEALEQPAEGPVYRVGAWCETAPYSGEWHYVEEVVVAASLEAAKAQSEIKPGYGNELKGEKAFDSYWDCVVRNVKNDGYMLAGIERYLDEDPVATEHMIFGHYIHLMENAKNTRAWIEQFSGLEPQDEAPLSELGESVAAQGRWGTVAALNKALAERLDRVTTMLEAPGSQAEELRDAYGEIIGLADQALTTISKSSPGEFRCCKDCKGPSVTRAVWQLQLPTPHDRRLDDDTFCVPHAQKHLDAYDERQQPVTAERLIAPGEPTMPEWTIPLKRHSE